MDRKGVHFERVGMAYMPCSGPGWGYLFTFVMTTLALLFLATAVWSFARWQGVEFIQGVILVLGVLATVRFAHKRSK